MGSKLSFEDVAMRTPFTYIQHFLALFDTIGTSATLVQDPDHPETLFVAKTPLAAVRWVKSFLSANEWSTAKSSGGEGPADETTIAKVAVHNVQTPNMNYGPQSLDSGDSSTASTACTALLKHGKRKRYRPESIFSRFGIKKRRGGSRHQPHQKSLRKSPDDDSDGSLRYESEPESSENTDHTDDRDDKSTCDTDLIASLPEAETKDEQRIKDMISGVNQDLPMLLSIMKSTVSKSVASTAASFVRYTVAGQMIYRARAIGNSSAIGNWSTIENWQINGTSPGHHYSDSVISIPEHIGKQPESIQGFYKVFQAVNQSDGGHSFSGHSSSAPSR
ncbi:hypothetical protein F5884DRAFT_758708 [Xylogone sp. PMI_703]|nr:hypothetical protein F5884DRAFT_758708 [Xylogone sp. PMI_703]